MYKNTITFSLSLRKRRIPTLKTSKFQNTLQGSACHITFTILPNQLQLFLFLIQEMIGKGNNVWDDTQPKTPWLLLMSYYCTVTVEEEPPRRVGHICSREHLIGQSIPRYESSNILNIFLDVPIKKNLQSFFFFFYSYSIILISIALVRNSQDWDYMSNFQLRN